MLRKWIAQLVCLLSLVSVAGAQVSLDEILSPSAVDGFLSGSGPRVVSTQSPAQGSKSYRVFHLEFKTRQDAKAFQAKGSYAFNTAYEFVDVFVEPTKEALTALAAAKGLVWAEDAGKVTPPNPIKLNQVAARATSEPTALGGVDGLTGKGVVIAIVDTGVDIYHPDFQTFDDKGQPVSRFEYVWDTFGSQNPSGSKAPITYPDGQSVGTLYTRDQITAALRGQSKIPLLDENGHGTACAGLAAGNGRASNGAYKGVAPNATLIGVRLGKQTVENSYLIGAVLQWLGSVTNDKRPMVISNSWGGEYNGHDGYRIIDRQVSMTNLLFRRGVITLFAAGNSGTNPTHAQATVTAAEGGVLEWEAPAGGSMLVFLNNPPEGTIELPSRTKRAVKNPLTKQVMWEYKLDKGAGNLAVRNPQTEEKIVVDAYIFGEGAKFKGKCLNYSTMISSPGSTANVLTIGSYDFNSVFQHQGKTLVLGVGDDMKIPMNVGAISAYSSPGYSRTGAVKPNVAAPGQWHTAAAPLSEQVKLIRDTTGKYRLFNGTSAATPYTAGVVALMLEKNPSLNQDDISILWQQHATRDLRTGKTPNPRWGNGKLDLAAIKRILGNI